MRDLLQRLLKEYDKVFMVTDRFVRAGDDWQRFCKVIQALECEKIKENIFFLIEEGVEYPLIFPHDILSHTEIQEVKSLYLTYEFSNRFSMFSDGKQYGTIFRYADTGILTEEETVVAILK